MWKISIFKNVSRSLLETCLSINSLRGLTPVSNASSADISLLDNGTTALSYICVNVGDITNMVKNKDKPINI